MALEYNQILELVCQGRSYREIADTLGCSHRDVSRVSKAVHEHHITHPSQVSAADLASWFPDGRSRISQTYQRPAWDSVLHAMRAQPHFTLLMAWRRYVDAGGNARKYGYSQFCALFADYVRRNDLVAVLHHEPGRAMLVDWAGDTMEVLDEATGEVTRVYLFVAVLPFSGALFARGYPDMKSPAWLDAHAQAFEFFAGVPQIVVPDNPTTSTIRPVRGDTERRINTRYQELADHYGTAIVPARVRKPRDKAAAERAVNVIGTRVIGYLEAETWTSPAELNEAIDTRVAEINHDMVRADGSTRWARFTDEEKPLLGPLPPTRFTEVEWRTLKAGRNYHITCESQHYSVPYQLAGRTLRVRLTGLQVTVFDDDRIVGQHRRLTGRKGQYSTLADHVAPQHREIDGLWSRAWFTDRAAGFGPATTAIIEQILDRHQIEAQAYLDCQNILSGLGKKGRARLEAAAQDLLNRGAYPTYTSLKRTMAAIDSDTKAPDRPVRVPATTKPSAPQATGADVYVRDASHYQIGEAR